MPAKVLHLIASNFISGPEKQILQHARDLADSPYEISVASFRDLTAAPEILLAAADQHTGSYCLPGGFNPNSVRRLVNILGRQRTAILCTHGYKANIVGRAASLLSGVPQVAFVRGWTAETSRVAFYENIERHILTRVPWVVCVSSMQAAQLSPKRQGRRAPIVIPNAVLPPPAMGPGAALTRAQAGLPQDAFAFGAVGRLSVEKGHCYLVEAFAALCKRIAAPNLCLVLLGDGRELSALRQQAASLGMTRKIIFAGFQSQIRPWFKMMDCLVQPSLTEGTPNSVLEALQENIPIIATAVGGVPDLIQDGVSGLLVSPRDPHALSSAMQRVLTSGPLRAKLAAGIDSLPPQYRPETQRASLLALYDDVLHNAPRSHSLG